MTIELAEPDPTLGVTPVLTFTYYPDKSGKWRWRCRAPNNKIVAVSGESFYNKATAERAATRMAQYFSQDVQVVTGLTPKTSAVSKFPEAYWPFITKARAKWGRLTAFRLGGELGLAGATLANPYEQGSVAHRQFKDGYHLAAKRAGWV